MGTLADDFYFFMNGSSETKSERNQTIDNPELKEWKTAPPVAKHFKELPLEAGIKQTGTRRRDETEKEPNHPRGCRKRVHGYLRWALRWHRRCGVLL